MAGGMGSALNMFDLDCDRPTPTSVDSVQQRASPAAPTGMAVRITG